MRRGRRASWIRRPEREWSASPRDLRRDYRATVERRRDRVAPVATHRRIAYHHVSTATPFGHALRRAAEGRARLG